MNFVVSSSELLNRLQTIGRVISSKNTLPILDHFLFQLTGNELKITASDLETTFVTTMNIENVTKEGSVTIPAKLFIDSLREFYDLPITFTQKEGESVVEITWETGKSIIPTSNVEDYPQFPELIEEYKNSIEIESDTLLESINRTLFATGVDQLRPVMSGIYFDMSNKDGSTFVASDAHKLVRYIRKDVKSDNSSSFILPQKPASILKTILQNNNKTVKIEFDKKNAMFTLDEYTLVCRLIEGIYPKYDAVIPKENPNKIIVDRVSFLNCIKRVSVFASQTNNLIKLKVTGNLLISYAQDLDFSISGNDKVNCQYDGADMEIGFKSTFLIEILSNMSSQNIIIELADSNRAALFLPFEEEKNENEDLLMLLMPMMIG